MKKFISGFVVCVALFYLVFGLCGYIESTYTKECKVIKIEDNSIFFEDENRMIWEWEKEKKEKEYSVNERVKLVMYDNYTLNAEDDEIRKVKREF